MTLTTRSLLLAVLACFSMALFAKSLPYSEGQGWITGVFLLATFALGLGGVWLGVKGARQQRTFRAWLAPGLNGFLLLTFLMLLLLFVEALRRIR